MVLTIKTSLPFSNTILMSNPLMILESCKLESKIYTVRHLCGGASWCHVNVHGVCPADKSFKTPSNSHWHRDHHHDTGLCKP